MTAHPGGSPPGSASLLITAGSNIVSGETLLVATCDQGAIFQVSAGHPGTSGQIPHNTGAGSPGNWTKALGRDFTGAEIFRTFSRSYFIAAGSGAAATPTLYRLNQNGSADELIEGVFDLQVSYGVDSSLIANGRIDSYQTADAVTNWDRVLALRLSLLLGSIEAGVADAPMSLFYNGATWTAPDRRLYQVVTTTVALRNRLP